MGIKLRIYTCRNNRSGKNFVTTVVILMLLSICLIVLVGIGKKELIKKEINAYLKAPVYIIRNFHVVTPGILRGSQPSEEGLAVLKDHFKIKTILSLRRDRRHNDWERNVAKRLNVEFISMPMSAGEEQSIDKIEKCLSIITDISMQPVFVHCHAGKDRTGLIMAAYRVKYEGWDPKEAIREMLAYGYDQTRFYPLKNSLRKWYSSLDGKRMSGR